MRDAARPSFAVVIPMLNEEAGAERCVRTVCSVLATLPHRTTLIIVNDGSNDGTGAILAALAQEYPALDLLTHVNNRGYGAALRSGVRQAADHGFKYVLFMDSDLTNAPGDIPRFAERMAEGLDVLKATRYRSGGRMVGVPWQRRCISRIGGLVARAMFRLPISDCTNGFRAVKTRILTQMDLNETRFPVIVEELYHCVFLARSFGEIPVVLASRAGDLRPTAFVYRPGTLYRYLKYCLLAFCRIPPPTGRARQEPGTFGED